MPTSQAVALVDNGDVDYLPTDFDPYSPLVPNGRLDRDYGPGSANARAGRQRYFLPPLAGVDYIVFNTKRPLFRDLNLRRAVNYALDRRALATAFRDTPTDHIIPLYLPGRPAGHAYPIDGPDLVTARRLAGRRNRVAVLSYCASIPRSVAEIVRANLSRIGIAVSIVSSPRCDKNPLAERADLSLGSSGTVERDPVAFVEEMLSSGHLGDHLGPGPWNEPSFRRRLEQARSLRADDRGSGAARLADEVARELAPFAVFGNWLHPDYVSARVGCKLYQAHYQFVDLGALCVQRP